MLFNNARKEKETIGTCDKSSFRSLIWVSSIDAPLTNWFLLCTSFNSMDGSICDRPKNCSQYCSSLRWTVDPILDFWVKGKQTCWSTSATVSEQVIKALGPCYQTVVCSLVLSASTGRFWKCRNWDLSLDLWELQFNKVPGWFVSTTKFEKHCFRDQNQLPGKAYRAMTVGLWI